MTVTVTVDEHHWKVCNQCGGKGGVKWRGFLEPLCEDCLVHIVDQEILTRSQA